MLEQVFKDFSESLNEFFKEAENLPEGDVNKTYTRYLFDKYEDGEKVFHHEKVTKDGKVVKECESVKNSDGTSTGYQNISPTNECKCDDNCECKNKLEKYAKKIEKQEQDYIELKSKYINALFDKESKNKEIAQLKTNLKSVENALVEKDEMIANLNDVVQKYANVFNDFSDILDKVK